MSDIRPGQVQRDLNRPIHACSERRVLGKYWPMSNDQYWWT